MNLTLLKELHEQRKEDIEKLLADIGVSDAQREELKGVKENAKAEFEPIFKSLFDHARQSIKYLATPEATEAGMLERKDDGLKIINELASARVKYLFQVKRLLSPEQQQKFAERLEEKLTTFQKAIAELRASA